jgi:hypothetical protein
MPLDNPRFDVGAARLTRLATALENLSGPDREQFNMQSYCSCAVHVAMSVPEFRVAGLYSEAGSDAPIFENKWALRALTEFFQINVDQATSIFYPNPGGAYPYGPVSFVITKRRPEEVAETIMAVVAEKVIG